MPESSLNTGQSYPEAKKDSITESVPESFTAIYSQDLKLNQKQTRLRLKLQTDSANDSDIALTITEALIKVEPITKSGLLHCCLYKDLKIYENHNHGQNI